MRIAVIFACGLLAASPALAHKEDLTPKTPSDPNKVVCKDEDVLGSRLQTQKQCMTVAQWEQMRREGMNTMDRIQGRSASQGH